MPHTPNYMRLAIIEDEKGAAELIRSHLSLLFDDHCEIEIAHDLTTAWEIIKLKGPFDIIFLDLNLMPHSPADETIKEIPDLLQHCNQLVVVSGLESSKYEEEVLRLGAIGYMPKLESLRSPRNFLEKLVQIFRTVRGPTEVDRNLEKLERVLAENSPKNG